MVWFQCEDCGEALKKPKLRGHFNCCSASKLVCIDCGSMFTQQSVQTHTTCITEMEKFGPKGENAPKGSGGTKSEKQQKETARPGDEGLDFNTGLSKRPPWRCSLCCVNATSQESIQSHAEGKKHRSKVRGQARAEAGGASNAAEAASTVAAQATEDTATATGTGTGTLPSPLTQNVTGAATATATASPSPLTQNGSEAAVAAASVPEGKLRDSAVTNGTLVEEGEKEGNSKSGKGKKRKQGGSEQTGDAKMAENGLVKRHEDNGTPKKKKKDKREKENANGDHPQGSKIENGHAGSGAGMNGHAEAAEQPRPSQKKEKERVKGDEAKGASDSPKDSKKTATAGNGEQQATEGQGGVEGALASIPWKKLIKKELKQDPTRSLPLRKLRLQAVAAAQAVLKEKGFPVEGGKDGEDGKDGAGVKRSHLEEELKRSLTRFKCFAQEGKQVVLKTES